MQRKIEEMCPDAESRGHSIKYYEFGDKPKHKLNPARAKWLVFERKWASTMTAETGNTTLQETREVNSVTPQLPTLEELKEIKEFDCVEIGLQRQAYVSPTAYPVSLCLSHLPL